MRAIGSVARAPWSVNSRRGEPPGAAAASARRADASSSPAGARLRLRLSSPPMSAPPPPGVSPQRHLGVRHAASVCIGMVIGAGIFETAPVVPANVDSDAGLWLDWACGGVLSFVVALCFAEPAAACPDAGGDEYFLRLAFGERTGWLLAWSRFAVIHTGSTALLAFDFGDYRAQVAPSGAAPRAASHLGTAGHFVFLA